MVATRANAEPTLSLAEKHFLLQALDKGIRTDGRAPYDFRSLKFQFGLQRGHVEVQLGRTRVLVRVSCDVVRPFPDRPTDGFLQFNLEFSQMASPAFDGRPTDDTIHIGRMIERALRQSRAIDTEGLCIVPEEKVWSIRCDIHILDDDGNITDCACIAAITALMHFRRPDVTVEDGQAIIHDLDKRQPVPLSIHHTPISVSFAFFEAGNQVVVDPHLLEEHVMQGQMTLTLNAQKEICAVSKAGGQPLSTSQIVQCSKIAAVKVTEIYGLIKDALKQDEDSRLASVPMET